MLDEAHLGGPGAISEGRGPLLVLGAGQRSGTTLLQRLLSSHPDVHIWGEAAGQLGWMLAAVEQMRFWTESVGGEGRQEFAEGGYQSFIANLTPESSRIDDAMRRFVEVLYADSALDLGRKVWGFKEVRYGLPEAQAIQRLFPEARVIHVVRDPRDILRSLDVWERNHIAWPRSETAITVSNWLRVTGSFLGAGPDSALPVLRLRYEDIVQDPVAAAAQVGGFARLDPDCFDLAVFARKIHCGGPGREDDREIRGWDALDASVRALLDRDDIRTVATACDYRL